MTMKGSGLDTIIGGKATAGNASAADVHFKKGYELEQAGDRLGAIEEYRAARAEDEHVHASFRLAYLLDLFGEEDESLELYDEIVHSPVEEVVGRLRQTVEERQDPLSAIIEGVDEGWEICLLKFASDLIEESAGGNLQDFRRRGLL